MPRILTIMAVAAALVSAGAADAASKSKRHRVFHPTPVTSWAAPAVTPPHYGPPWAGPNQCWSDEGYGRWSPCDTGGKGG